MTRNYGQTHRPENDPTPTPSSARPAHDRQNVREADPASGEGAGSARSIEVADAEINDVGVDVFAVGALGCFLEFLPDSLVGIRLPLADRRCHFTCPGVCCLVA